MKVVQIYVSRLTDLPGNRTYTESGVRALTRSVKQLGVLLPLIVNTQNQVVAGSRRLAAAKAAGLEFVPCRVIPDEMDESTVRLVENAQRENLEPLEEAIALKAKYSSPEHAAEGLGMPLATMRRRFALLGLHQSVKDALVSGEIELSWAEVCSELTPGDQAEALASYRQPYGPKTAADLKRWSENRVSLPNMPEDGTLNRPRGKSVEKAVRERYHKSLWTEVSDALKGSRFEPPALGVVEKMAKHLGIDPDKVKAKVMEAGPDDGD